MCDPVRASRPNPGGEPAGRGRHTLWGAHGTRRVWHRTFDSTTHASAVAAPDGRPSRTPVGAQAASGSRPPLRGLRVAIGSVGGPRAIVRSPVLYCRPLRLVVGFYYIRPTWNGSNRARGRGALGFPLAFFVMGVLTLPGGQHSKRGGDRVGHERPRRCGRRRRHRHPLFPRADRRGTDVAPCRPVVGRGSALALLLRRRSPIDRAVCPAPAGRAVHPRPAAPAGRHRGAARGDKHRGRPADRVSCRSADLRCSCDARGGVARCARLGEPEGPRATPLLRRRAAPPLTEGPRATPLLRRRAAPPLTEVRVPRRCCGGAPHLLGRRSGCGYW